MTTREKIIDVSIELFSTSGYHGVSIRDITKIVGIRESSLYKHFGSKEEILETIFDLFLKSYNQNNLSDDELVAILAKVDLLSFLRISIEKFYQEMEKPALEQIFMILMNEQFRVEKARNLIVENLLHSPVRFYAKVFKEKLKDKYSNYSFIAREFHYPIFAMVYEYSISKDQNDKLAVIKGQIFEHIDLFCDKVLSN